MDLNSDPDQKKDKQPTKNGGDFDVLSKDEAFWQKAVKSLAKARISDANDELSENVSK